MNSLRNFQLKIGKEFLLILYLVSFMLLQFSINIGFSFKPYMLMSLFIIIITVGSNRAVRIPIINNIAVYELFLILFIVYATVRNIFASDIVLGFKGSVALLFSLFVYYFTYMIFKNVSNEELIGIIYKSGIFSICIIVIGFLIRDNRIYELDRSVNRLRGYVQDPNFLALYLALPLFIALYYTLTKKKNIVTTIILFVMIFLTYSRAAYLSIVISLLYFLFVLRNHINRFKSKVIFGLVLIVLVLILLYNLPITKPTMQMATNNIFARFNETASRGARELLIDIGIDTFKEHPLFGIGMLNVRYYTRPFVSNNYLHNTYLEVFVEQGFVGGFLYLGFIISFMLRKCRIEYSKVVKSVIVSQLLMIFFLSAVNNEALFLSIGLYKAVYSKEKISFNTSQN